jgi:hypothetical protein
VAAPDRGRLTFEATSTVEQSETVARERYYEPDRHYQLVESQRRLALVGPLRLADVAEPAELLTTAQAARWIGVSRRTLARYAELGWLKPTVTLPSGHHRWELEDLRRQVRELRQRTDDE